ncbi:ATP synthase F0 subunit B [Desulfonatronospira sp.]|uniref:ATP synthase F0 subunit B n=1 Tax=Desulfonatronospira sp. TaxID=1962951 RepID=UPI0025C1D4E4|nr:ATP synthase F0 subunit B [Desulfonatronospira sp.]
MIDLNITFFIQLVNFFIVLLLLNLILYKPIRGMLRKRAEIMNQKVEDVESFNSQADEKLKTYEKELEKARLKAQELRQEKKNEGLDTEKQIVQAASDEASSILQSAREKARKEKDSALTALKKQVDKFAGNAADRILGKA